MNLGSVTDAINSLSNDDFVFSRAFHHAHSYRGYYNEVSFEQGYEITLREVKEQLDKAFEEEFTGWKGGEFRYDSGTPCHLSSQGMCYDEDGTEFEALVGQMFVEYHSR